MVYTIHCKDGSRLDIGGEPEKLNGDAKKVDELNRILLARLGEVTRIRTLQDAVDWTKKHPSNGVVLTFVGKAFDDIAQVVAGVYFGNKASEFEFVDYLTALSESERYRTTYLKNLAQSLDPDSKLYSQ